MSDHDRKEIEDYKKEVEVLEEQIAAQYERIQKSVSLPIRVTMQAPGDFEINKCTQCNMLIQCCITSPIYDDQKRVWTLLDGGALCPDCERIALHEYAYSMKRENEALAEKLAKKAPAKKKGGNRARSKP